MQNKMQTPVLLSNFVSYVENHFQTSINIRSDNGTKFIQGQCATLFGTKGIIQHKSVPKTPQQNGRIERKHRHLIDTTRVLKLHVSLQINFGVIVSWLLLTSSTSFLQLCLSGRNLMNVYSTSLLITTCSR